MARLIAALLLLAGLLGPLGGAAQAPIPATPAKPVRVLFIGNSLTFWTEIPARVGKVVEATGRKATIESVALPSFSLQDHWNDGRALAAIRKGWDIVVLQQGTSADAESRAQLVEYAKRLAKPIREAGARPAIYMVWPTRDRGRDFPATIASHRAAAQATDAILIPAGEAWLRALSKDPRLNLYADAIHPTSLGSDIAVLAIYFSLFPAGQTEFDVNYVEKIANALDIPAARRELFFDVATRAIDEPLTLADDRAR